MFRWAYFVTYDELVDRHKKAGGRLGTFNSDNPDDIEHARRAILKFLLPGPVSVWDGLIGAKTGFVFFVGKSVPQPREAFGRELASRCYQIFGREPDTCKSIRNSDKLWWNIYLRDGTKQLLKLGEFLGSDTEGDMYSLTPEQIAMLTSNSSQ
ncbi:unnamed protein product [Rhizoctonia solani]|uniref:Uncharacterized protein n=1 Tax=Rhizoctonia solani TaxID=456999 RepID=A0A8H3B5S3_9AGAM|nr:unnamed protein product [Rhizoctonia solani]CAE6509819.1 unnamed protein product [Rhizoctonia solani]